MTEREEYQLPSEVGGEFIYLPDYVTLWFNIDNLQYEAQVNPERVDWFMEDQEMIHAGREVIWL
jgi:hypothetical protein